MNDIDLLMSKPALDLTPTDIESIVAYHRAQRFGGKAEAAKAARKANTTTTIDIDIAGMMKSLGPPLPLPPSQIMKRKI